MNNLIASLQQKMNELGQKNAKNDLLVRQQDTTNKINALLEQSAEAISCGPTCQKLKVSSELKQKYLDAQTNMITAPIKLEETKKNYYVYTEGRPYYDDIKEAELKEKAEKIGILLSENFYKEDLSIKPLN